MTIEKNEIIERFKAIDAEKENSVTVSKPLETAAGDNKPEEKVLTQEEKDAQFKKAYIALARLMKSRKKKHRGVNPGAFGGIGTLRKKKKKLARFLSKHTVL